MAISYNPSSVTSGLVLCLDAANSKSYPGSGTTWTDLSGRGNTGTLVNGVGYNSGNLGSLVFDGVNDYVDCGNNTTLNLQIPFTLSIWVYPKNSTLTQTLFGKRSTDFASENYSLNLFDGKFLYYDGRNASATALTSTYNVNTWYNFVASIETTNLINLYVNSINQYSGNGNRSGNVPTNSASLKIGNLLNVGSLIQHSIADISQASIYNRALSAAEISQNYNALKSRFGLP